MQQQRHDPLRTLCKLAGVPDVESYLGLRAGVSGKEALVVLERKRRELESVLGEPARAREAELFLECYDHLRAHVARDARRVVRLAPDAPDYYAVLGVQPDASYAEIERAWRRLQAAGREGEALPSQAWRVLGDPLNRAHFDRARREQVTEAAPPPPPDPVVEEPPTAVAELGGPEVHEVLLEGEGSAVVALPLTVRGREHWRATITVDHRCMSTQPDQVVSVAPGRHTLLVRVDPRKVPGRVLTATMTLGNAHEQHVAVFRIRRPASARGGMQALALGAAATLGVLVVLALAVLVVRATDLSVLRQPASVGAIAQLPTASSCFSPGHAPLPGHVDVHIDGLGRPTGFTFGGVTSPEAEACVRSALARLQFPATPDGLPAFHRYEVAPSPVSP